MLSNDNIITQKISPSVAPQPVDIAEYVRVMATDLERLSQQSGLDGMAACLRAVVCEARRFKNDERLLKLGVTPDRRLG
jgi:hypothetical protein